jgi:hypothetical protein
MLNSADVDADAGAGVTDDAVTDDAVTDDAVTDDAVTDDAADELLSFLMLLMGVSIIAIPHVRSIGFEVVAFCAHFCS